MTSRKPRRPTGPAPSQQAQDAEPFSRFRRTAGGLDDRDAIDQLTKAVRRLIPPRLPGKKANPAPRTAVTPSPPSPRAKTED
jgi:hypothetical protein